MSLLKVGGDGGATPTKKKLPPFSVSILCLVVVVLGKGGALLSIPSTPIPSGFDAYADRYSCIKLALKEYMKTQETFANQQKN